MNLSRIYNPLIHRVTGGDFKDNGFRQTKRPFSTINMPLSAGTNSEIKLMLNTVGTSHEILGPGMFLFKNVISHRGQAEIVNICQEFGGRPEGFYMPSDHHGERRGQHMMCFGKNWDPQKVFHGRRSHGSEAPPIPEKLISLVETLVQDSQIDPNSEDVLPLMSPDICIVNFYAITNYIRLHQDCDESSYRRGLPVVCISIGDSAEFMYGHRSSVFEVDDVLLESGDVLILGEKSRHIFRGVRSFVPDSAPLPLLEETNVRPGHLNLMFRQS